MAPTTEAVLFVKEFLEGLNFPLAPQCIEGDLQSMTGILASTDASFLVTRLVQKLAKLVPRELAESINRGVSERAEHDPSLVQVTASKAEVDTRIAAFMARKQIEADDKNIREFTDVTRSNQPDGMTCARVRPASLHRYPRGNHMKLSRQLPVPVSVAVSSADSKVDGGSSRTSPDAVNSIVLARCAQLEQQVALPIVSTRNIYDRIKYLEQRVLELEARSPEYLASQMVHNKSSNLKLHFTPSKLSGRERRCKGLLASHPYGQASRDFIAPLGSSSVGSRRCSDDDASSSYVFQLHERLNMKPLYLVP